MKLDCIKATDVGLGSGWVIVNTENGGIVAHTHHLDSEFAWMEAAHSLASAISEMQRAIYEASPQQFSKVTP